MRDALKERPVNRPLAGQRILFVVNVDWFFSSHRLPLALAAMEAGATVAVATADTGHLGQIRDSGVTVYRVPFTRAGRSARGELQAAAGLRRAIRAFDPHLLHNVTAKGVLHGTFAALRGRRCSVNAVSGFGYVHDSAAAGSVASRVIQAVYLKALTRSDAVIVQNTSDQRIVSAAGVDSSRIHLIPGSGVDLDAFKPRALEESRPNDPVVVTMASRLLWSKGVGEFVAAAEIVKQTDSNVRFVLVGPADDDNPTAVSSVQLRRWVDAGTIEWWGRRSDMPEVLRSSDVFVLPTYYREGVPKALLEAAACGLPSITTDTPGCNDAVSHGHTGLLVDPRDCEQLADAVLQLSRDPNIRSSMGRQARTAAERRFGIKAVQDATVSIYMDVLNLAGP